jgi:predicted RNA binding protein YcfA (HicA-like mRNA interferase family)
VGRLPVISGDDAIRAFERAGWVRRHQVGSHVTMDKEGMPATLSIPLHRELGRGLLRSLIRDAGMTVKEFTDLL